MIVKNKEIIIKIFETYIEFISKYENRIIGIKNIKVIYINKNIQVSNLSKLSKYLDVFIIEDDGTVIWEIDAKI